MNDMTIIPIAVLQQAVDFINEHHGAACSGAATLTRTLGQSGNAGIKLHGELTARVTELELASVNGATTDGQ